MRITVLMGGWSAEREVSLTSGAAVAAALRRLGHDVIELDMARDIATVLPATRPELMFNALHGTPGEDGGVQGLMDLLGLAYTHSGVAASAIAIDKVLTKAFLLPLGLPMPGGRVVSADELAAGDPLPRPYVMKPVNEGSSVGVTIVAGDTPRPAATRPMLCEPFIPGRELTVAVLGDEALAVTELKPAQGFYDYAAKYTEGRTRHVCPADVPGDVREAALAIALQAHRALGCRHVSRSDFRWDDRAGVAGLFLLEINTQPGMTPLSLVPEQAAHRGLDFDSLVARIVALAMAPAPGVAQ